MPVIIAFCAGLILFMAGVLVNKIDVHVSQSGARNIASSSTDSDKLNHLISELPNRAQVKPHPLFDINVEKQNLKDGTIMVTAQILPKSNIANVSWKIVGDISNVVGESAGDLGRLKVSQDQTVSIHFQQTGAKPVFFELFTVVDGRKMGLTRGLPVYENPLPPDQASTLKTFSSGKPPKLHF